LQQIGASSQCFVIDELIKHVSHTRRERRTLACI